MTPFQKTARAKFLARDEYLAMLNLDAGRALAQIRADRSWPDKYLSFESYVREEWGIGTTLCKRLIRRASTCDANAPTIPQRQPDTVEGSSTQHE